jgi:bifunctional UDP-N-acetylglucosamine pyrophosphorylase/glucosamine-1-phosphate N-acetyltransferase
VAHSLKVTAVSTEQEWEALGVNSKEQLASLERQLQKNQAQALLEQGVTLLDPARFDLRGTLKCGRDVTIDVGCIFEGSVKLGDGVKVGAYSILKDCEVGANTVIHPFCHLQGGMLGEANIIGPYARVRPETTTAKGVHLGNFVEVKNSQVGEGSKANHLAYVGDASVGRNVNVGAGTITCNYDGANKHRTIIEDDVFIGSDSQLVAPVTIAAGSTIGAGSTIVSNTPPNQLTVSRSKQVSIARWNRPKKG